MPLLSFVLFFLLSCLPAAATTNSHLTESSPPNILLIIADDMGLDASRCYQVGKQQAPMPNYFKWQAVSHSEYTTMAFTTRIVT